MPNWCYTNIKFYSKNPNQLMALFKRFNRGSENNSLYDLMKSFYPNETNAFDARGCIISSDDEVNRLKNKDGVSISYFGIDTETAWSPKIGIFQKILQDFYPDVELAYLANEDGYGVALKYDNNNLFFDANYHLNANFPYYEEIDWCPDKIDFSSINELLNYLRTELPLLHLNNINPTTECNEIEEQILRAYEKYIEL